jgi:hypothetical protein
MTKEGIIGRCEIDSFMSERIEDSDSGNAQAEAVGKAR